MGFTSYLSIANLTNFTNDLSAVAAGGAVETSPQEFVAYVSLLAFLVLLLALRFFSSKEFFGDNQIKRDFQSIGGELSNFRTNRRVDHLFLKLKYSSIKAKKDLAYLRSLEPLGASLMIPEMLWVGSRIILHLDTLPGFPQDNIQDLDAKVVSCSVADEDHENFVIKVKFEAAKAKEISQPILGYIESLARPVG